MAGGTRVDAIRERDRRYIITGEETLGVGETRWFSFEAAHAFPLAYTEWSMATVVGPFSRVLEDTTNTSFIQLKYTYVKEVLFGPQVVPHGVIAYMRVFAMN